MARKNDGPLTQADVERFVAQSSDFGFEMAALAILRKVGFQAEHAATYTDPITNRIRAYDMRAHWASSALAIHLAVECKNLRPSSPLVVHATPRQFTEAYHTLLTRYRINGSFFQSSARRDNALSVYAPDEPVGRQTDQPTMDASGDFTSSDAPTFEKWLQAVNGCRDLLKGVLEAPLSSAELHAIVPVLVVPDQMLWQVDYDDNGKTKVPVRQVDWTTLVLRHKWSVPSIFGPVEFDISHLEIVTPAALKQRLKNLIGSGAFFMGSDALFKEMR
jgi:hypothetical protein